MLFVFIAASLQIGAARHASSRLHAELMKELSQYRLILLAPRLPAPKPVPQRHLTRKRTDREPKPLAVPDPRLLHDMNPELAAFIGENQNLENILTREIVRDLDTRAINAQELLEDCAVRVGFDIDSGHISNRSIEQSSGTPSLDHLLLELITLLEKYQLLRFFGDIRHVVASMTSGAQIEIRLTGEVESAAKPDAIRGQIEAGLILWRMFLQEEDAELLKEIAIRSEGRQITVSKSFAKEAVLELVRRYVQTGAAK